MCKQAVDAAQVDERAEVGDVLDGSLANLTDGDFLEQLLLLVLARDLDQLAAADDDVAAALIDLEDHAFDFLIDVVGDIGRAADVDLAGRQEDVDADIDQQTAFDLARDLAFDDVSFVMAGDDHFPRAHPVRLLARQDDLAGLVFHALEQDLDVLAGNRRRLVLPLVQGDQALGLVADIHDHLVADDLDDLARDNAANLEALTSAQDLFECVRAVFPGHQGRELVFIDIEFTKQITIYHVPVSSLFRPTRNEQGRSIAATASDDANGTRNHPGSAVPFGITSCATGRRKPL